MQTVVLAISSFVAASRVGLNVLVPALRVFPVETIAVPTTLFGRHPGWGSPGGAAVATPLLKDMLDGALAHPDAPRCAWAVTGYFASADQVKAAADAILKLKERARDLKVLVDPIMGDDETGRYVGEDVPAAIERRLLPLADVVAPNAWEAEVLTGVRVIDPQSALEAAAAFAKPALISSVRTDGRIGAVYAETGGAAWYAHAETRPEPPKGTGDLLTGAFLGGLATRLDPPRALETAVRLVDFAIETAISARLDELPTSGLSMFSGAWPPPVPARGVTLTALSFAGS